MGKWLLTRYNLQYLSRSDPKEGKHFQKSGRLGAGDRWFRGAWPLSWAWWHMPVILAWRKKWEDQKLGASLGCRNDTVLWNRNGRKDLWFHSVQKKKKERSIPWHDGTHVSNSSASETETWAMPCVRGFIGLQWVPGVTSELQSETLSQQKKKQTRPTARKNHC